MFHFVILGDPFSGKSSLMLRYADDSFSSYCKSYSPMSKYRKLELNTEIIETRVWDNSPEKISSADAIILVCDTTNKNSFKNLPDHINTIKQNTDNNNVILVGSKSDCFKERKVTIQQMEVLAKAHNYYYIECSAKNMDVDNIFEIAILASKMSNKVKLYNLIYSISTDSLFWEFKTRVGKIPKGALQFAQMDSLESIIQHANYKHSAHFFALHNIFRGRDKVTNDFYQIIKQIDVNDEQSIQDAIDNLTNMRNTNSIHYINALN